MGYNFPSAPVYGEVYEDYAWDGEKWLCGKLTSPDWVPEGALVHIEFYDGVARAWDGTGLLDGVGIGALLGNDPNMDMWSGGSEYSPDGVTANGYDYNNFAGSYYAPAALGALKALLPSPLTYVVTSNFDEWYAEMYMALVPAGADTGNVEIWSTVGGNIQAYTDSGVSLELPGAYNTEPGVFKQNRIAFTHRPPIDGAEGLLAISANGSDVVQSPLTGADFLGGLNQSWYIDNIPLQAITVYEEQSIEALPVLSNLHLAPEIRGVTPRDVEIGGAAFELTVEGYSFDEGAIVLVDGVDQPTVYVSANVLTATLQGSATATTVEITVRGGDDRMSNAHDVEFYDPVAGPVWANGASVFIDLIKPGRVWTGTEVLDADAATGIGLFLGHDATTNAYVGGSYTVYDQRVVQIEGYNASWLNGTNRIPAYLVPLKETLLYPGATLQVTTRTTAGWWVKRPKLVFTASDALNYITVQQAAAAYTITARGGPLNLTSMNSFVEPVGESYEQYIRNRFAMTLAGTRLEFAANGVAGSLVTAVLSDLDRPAANPLTGIVEDGYNIESIAIYPLLPTTDGLVDLSSLDYSGAPPVVLVAPTLTSVDPASVTAGGAEFQLTLTGTDFTADCIVYTAGAVPEPTIFVNDTTLTAMVNTIAQPGSLSVKVTNSVGTSNVLQITFTAAAIPAPDWVPEGASVHIEFTGAGTARAYDGTAVYDATTLDQVMLGKDPDSDLWNYDSVYNPASITALGYDYYAAGEYYAPAALGTLKQMLAEGLTLVVKYGLNATHNDPYLAFNSGQPSAIEISLSIAEVISVYSPNGRVTLVGQAFDQATAAGERYPNVIAYTLTPTRSEISINGMQARAENMGQYDFPNGPPTGLYIDGGDITSITAYPPLAKEDLPLLSAVPVKISSVMPVEVPTSTTITEVTVKGANFHNCVVQIDGIDQPNIFTDSPTSIRMVSWMSGMTVGEERVVTVKNLLTGEVSNALTMKQFDPEVGPSWLPPGAVMHIDFLTPRAWDGVVNVVLAASSIGYQCLGTDNNAHAYLAPLTTGYDYERIEPTGYYYHETWPLPAYISSMRQAVLADCTVVITLNSDYEGIPPEIALISADGLTGIVAGTNGTADMTVTSRRGPLALSVPGAWVVPATATDVRNRYAFTSTATRFEIAVNGSAAAAGVVDATDRDATVVAIANKGANIESITVYPPLADAAALSDYSSLTFTPPPTGGGGEGGGGEPPAWLPADATMMADFIAPGRSFDGTTEGDGSTGLGGMVGNDPAIATPTGYDAASLSATGYDYQVVPAMPPACLGALKDAIIGDVTFTMAFNPASSGDVPPGLTIRSADGLAGLTITANGSNLQITTLGGLALTLPGVYYTSMLNRIAINLSQTRCEVACNGFGQVLGTLIAADRPAASPWSNVFVTGTDLKEIVVYPLMADSSGLMNLSSSLSTRSAADEEGRRRVKVKRTMRERRRAGKTQRNNRGET